MAQNVGSETPGLSTEPVPEERPVGQLVADMTSQIGALIRKEVELAREELRDEVRQAAKAGGMLGGGALTGYFSLLFASLALAWFLDKRMPRSVAFFLVAALHGTAAVALLARARQEIEQVDPVPRETVETIREDVEFVKSQAP